MRAVASVAAQTLLEIVRARVLHALIVFAAVLAWGSLFIGDLSFESQAEIALDLSLAGVGLFCSLASILLALEFVGTAVRPTVWPAVASGVSRTRLFLGRWAAVAIVSAALSVLAPLTLIAFFFLLGYDPRNQLDLFHAILLMPLENVVWASACSAFVIFSPRALAFATALGYWAVANLHHHPFTYGALRSDLDGKLLLIVGVFLPDVEFYNARLLEHFTPRLVLAAAVQSACFCAAFLIVGLLFFRRKDL